jgi:Zn-dependent protease with chaperone function
VKGTACILGLLLLSSSAPWAQTPIRPSSSTQKALARLNAMTASGKLHLSQSKELPRIDRIGQSVAAMCRRPVPWVFYVSTDKTPNAFTLGEGVVVVTEGLLKLNLDDDELAGVLAHEVAHGSQQHLENADNRNQMALDGYREAQAINNEKRQLDRAKRNGMSEDDYQSKIYQLKRRVEELNTKAAYLNGQSRFFKQLSQEQEIDADVWGLRYAIAAGYSQDGLEHALQKLLQFGVETFGQSFNGEGMTHPSIPRRIEVLHRVEASMTRSAQRS